VADRDETVKTLFVGFLAVESLLIAALWAVAVSGFWYSVSVGLVACVFAALVTALVIAAMRVGREDLWR
jgi:hypothetical protein